MIRQLVDSVTLAASADSVHGSANILLLIGAVVMIWFLDEVCSDIGSFVRSRQSVKLEAHVYRLIHEKAIKLDLLSFGRPDYLNCLSRAVREAPWRPNNILNNLISITRALFSLVLMAGVIISLHWIFALLLIAVNMPVIWLRLHFAKLVHNTRREQTPEQRKAYYFNWLLTGDRPSREIRLFGLGKYFISLFNISFLKTKEEELSIVKKRALIELFSDIFKAAAVLVVLLHVTRATINGSLTLGLMAMFLLAFRQGMVSIRELFTSISGLHEDSLYIGDIFEFLSLEESLHAHPPVTPVAGFTRGITVREISFTYPGNKHKTLDSVSLDIMKGRIIAIVGPNGAGKSTLARLICRLYDPDSGSISCDGTNVKNMIPEDYRKLFSVLFQDFMLYNLSAGENIWLGNINKVYTRSGIQSAARATGIDALIESLPRGYDTMIGNLFDESRELSWGEWQKLALSRAFFRDSPILILDEPSSALDPDAEYEIFSRFRELVKGKTSILISHRFTNVRLADTIIVLSKGSVAETGTHDELMKKKGIYHDMYIRQSNRFRDES
jgi:ATP-binding cassette subfamily B protein